MLAFEYYEASAVAYGADRRAEELTIDSEADVLAVLVEAERRLEMAHKRQRLVTEIFPKHRELLHQIDFDRYTMLRGDTWGGGLIWTAFDWADRSERVRQRLEELAGSAGETSLAAKNHAHDARQFLGTSLSKNPSFEKPKQEMAHGMVTVGQMGNRIHDRQSPGGPLRRSWCAVQGHETWRPEPDPHRVARPLRRRHHDPRPQGATGNATITVQHDAPGR